MPSTIFLLNSVVAVKIVGECLMVVVWFVSFDCLPLVRDELLNSHPTTQSFLCSAAARIGVAAAPLLKCHGIRPTSYDSYPASCCSKNGLKDGAPEVV